MRHCAVVRPGWADGRANRLPKGRETRMKRPDETAGCPGRSVCYSDRWRIPMPETREKAQLMSASEIDRTLVRLAHEVLEKSEDLDRLAFIGIRRRGVPIAQRLAAKIKALEGVEIPVGILDITLYRDDLSTVAAQPVVHATEIGFP